MAYELEGIRQIDVNELKEQYRSKKNTPIMIDIREPGNMRNGTYRGCLCFR
ncbi:hypothetical protein ACFOLK_17340 [Marinococcus halophilus]|uniref:hypothetical protein n=1 Tax=Marinococcus halophilus TaxID=1371 RepID=UPI00360AFA91